MLILINSDTRIFLVHQSLSPYDFISPKIIPQKEMTQLDQKTCTFKKFDRACQIILQKDCTKLYFHNGIVYFSILYITSIFNFHKFKKYSFTYVTKISTVLLITNGIQAFCFFKTSSQGFPGGSLVKNTPANARDMNSIPDPGKSHMPQSNQA